MGEQARPPVARRAENVGEVGKAGTAGGGRRRMGHLCFPASLAPGSDAQDSGAGGETTLIRLAMPAWPLFSSRVRVEGLACHSLSA